MRLYVFVLKTTANSCSRVNNCHDRCRSLIMASELLHGVLGKEPHRDAPRQQEPTADAQEEAPATAVARGTELVGSITKSQKAEGLNALTKIKRTQGWEAKRGGPRKSWSRN